MAVYSMTGYASAQYSGPANLVEGAPKPATSGRLGLEIRSVNSRFLDLAFRLPEELRHVEPALRERVSKHCHILLPQRLKSRLAIVRLIRPQA